MDVEPFLEELADWARAQGRMLERWAEPQDLAELGDTYAAFDPSDVARAIRATASMFKRIETDVYGPLVDHDEVESRLEALLDPVQRE